MARVRYSSFSQPFNLPENISDDDIKAWYDDGVLRSSITKESLD